MTLLEDETRALALHIASASSFVIGLGKRAFYAQIGENRRPGRTIQLR